MVISSFDNEFFQLISERVLILGYRGEKIGIKTTASLLRTFGTLENIINNAENIDKPSIKKSIVENTDRIRKNYELIKLEKNQRLPYNKCDLKFFHTNNRI